MSKRNILGYDFTYHAPFASAEDVRKRAEQEHQIVFLGWQRAFSGEIYPLYNILQPGHPLFKSTVTEKTLREQHLRVPRTPSPYPGPVPSPWHNLGTELSNPGTAREAVQAGGLDYTVVRKAVKGDDVSRWANVRTDTGEVLGVAGDDREPIQNADAFAFFDNLIGTDEATYETAGTIGRGERAWILAKLPGFIKVRGNDIVNKYLLLSNSHDGSSHVRVKLTPIRMVCSNTLASALQGAGEVHIRPGKNASENMTQALSLLGLATRLYEQLDHIFNRMALTKITDTQLLDFVKALVPEDDADGNPGATEAIRRTFLELYDSGQGANLSRGTLWGAFNCVTEYADHKMEGNPKARLESMWFGKGEQMKLKAFQLAERLM